MENEWQDKNDDSQAYEKELHKEKWCCILRKQCYCSDFVLHPEGSGISEDILLNKMLTYITKM